MSRTRESRPCADKRRDRIGLPTHRRRGSRAAVAAIRARLVAVVLRLVAAFLSSSMFDLSLVAATQRTVSARRAA